MQLGQSRTLPVEKPELIDLAQAARYFGARGEADTATMALLQRCAAHCASVSCSPICLWKLSRKRRFSCGDVFPLRMRKMLFRLRISSLRATSVAVSSVSLSTRWRHCTKARCSFTRRLLLPPSAL